MRIVLLLACAALAGQAVAAPAKTPAYKSEVASLRDGFDANLIDYGSARFREVRISTDEVSVCGFVNSKNRMGGYTGWQRFFAVALPSMPAHITIASDEVTISVVAKMCEGVGDKWAPGDLSPRLSPKP